VTAAIVAVVGGYVVALGLIAWLVYGRIAAANTLQAMDDERDKAIAEADALKFQLANTKAALDDETARANAFEEALADVEANPNSDLPRNAAGIRERVRRAAEAARARRKNGVPGGADDAVHPPPAAGSTDTAEVPVEPRPIGDGVMQPD
jgi:hypothetical protein